MTVNFKFQQNVEEYRQKMKLGIIEKSKRLNPIEKAKQNPNSLRFAINTKCYDCSDFIKTDVTDCDMPDCELFNVRPWQRPHINTSVNGVGMLLSEKSALKKYSCSDRKILQERCNPDGILLSPYAKLKTNPKSLRAGINAYCFWCSCEQYREVKLCTGGGCPLYHLRPWQ